MSAKGIDRQQSEGWHGVEEKITLEKIDIVRERAGVSYRKAYEVLKESGGDVVQALIRMEEEPRAFTERIQVQGSELVARIRQIIREGNVNRITIRRGGKVLLDIPVTVGAVGAVLMPYLAALGVIAALATRCTIEVERRTGAGTPGAGGGGHPYTGVAGARAADENPSQEALLATPVPAAPPATPATPPAPRAVRLDAAEELAPPRGEWRPADHPTARLDAAADPASQPRRRPAKK